MYRRALLGTAATLCGAIAGCFGQAADQSTADEPRATVQMEPITDDEIVRRVYRTVDADGTATARLLERATTNGTATVRALEPPLPDGRRVVYDGAVYDVSMTVTDESPVTVVPVEVTDLSSGDATVSDDASEIRFDDLPAVDREALGNVGLEDGSPLGVETTLVYPTSDIEQSVLVPSSEYSVILWGSETRGRLTVRGEPVERTRSTYRYSLTTVDESVSAHGRHLRETYAVELDNLSVAEAPIVVEAADGDPYTVSQEESLGNGFQSFADRFRGVPSVHSVQPGTDTDPSSATGTYLVRYDGEVYWLELVVRPPETDSG